MTVHTGKSGRMGWVITWFLLLEAHLAHSLHTGVFAWMNFPKLQQLSHTPKHLLHHYREGFMMLLEYL